ncbi:MAG: beta-lactamase family protein [Clostridia bacterium]|nr:beta-lactamase family protein [Clostridia bacterium]
MKALEQRLDTLIAEKTVRNLMVRVGHGDEILYDACKTVEDRVLTDQTLFDMASVTKIVVTTSLALIALDRGLLSVTDPVSRFFPVPEDKENLTVFHLLTHTMGIGHKNLTSTADIANIEAHILSIPSDIPIGSDTRYSCPGFILLGRILEKLYGQRLDEAFTAHVAAPLGMVSSGYHPGQTLDIVNANQTSELCGVVNDYNCRFLGGIAGNAGLFSNLADMTRYVRMLRNDGAPIITRDTFAEACRNHTPGMNDARGLGYLFVDERYAQTGGLFPTGSIGHCGHTGQSVFVDLQSGLYVIILSDATASVTLKYGGEKYAEVMQMRHDIHAAIKEDLNL